MFAERHQDDGSVNGDRPRGPLSHALDAAREQLGLDIVCVSRSVRADDLGGGPSHSPASLADNVEIVPLEAADGTLYGSLVCRATGSDSALDDRDRAYLRVLGRSIGALVERSHHERSRRRAQAESSGMHALLAAVEARDRYTGDHSRSVVDLSVRVARAMGLGDHEIAEVERVALLHDVGKVAVPDAVLNKPGPLTQSETEQVRRHPSVGARMVAAVAELAHLAPAIRSGHERWDGHGYPDGLRAEEIPLVSRITFVCDAYDAMISDRPYRSALGPKTARDEIRAGAGSQFCPSAARALLGVVERLPAAAPARRRARLAEPTS